MSGNKEGPKEELRRTVHFHMLLRAQAELLHRIGAQFRSGSRRQNLHLTV